MKSTTGNVFISTFLSFDLQGLGRILLDGESTKLKSLETYFGLMCKICAEIAKQDILHKILAKKEEMFLFFSFMIHKLPKKEEMFLFFSFMLYKLSSDEFL